MIELAAVIFCIVIALLAIFQISLIAGAPLGNYAWGGKYKILPLKLRISSVFSILLYALFAVTILGKAGIVTPISYTNILVWILAGYLTIGIVMNGISRSHKERNIMTPIAAILAVLAIIVALS